MRKSQLRTLAQRYTRGELDWSEYRRQRTLLIEGIVGGEIPIERVAEGGPARTAASASATVGAPATGPAPAPPQPAEEPGGRVARLAPLAIGAALVAAFFVVWIFLPSDEPAPAPGAGAPAAPDPAGEPAAPSAPPARSLVREFVQRNDWSELSLQRFLAEWETLGAEARAQARDAAWFLPLVNGVRQEINARKALAALDPGASSTRELAALARFGEQLGLGPMLPDAGVDPGGAAPAAGGAAAGAGEGPGPEPPPAPAAPLLLDDRVRGGLAWLSEQSPQAFTLQLFAMNRLDNVQRLIEQHRGLDLRVLAFDVLEPRFRVLHEAFDSAESAIAAHARLPRTLAGGQSPPVVKSIAELQALVVREAELDHPALAEDGAWLEEQSRTSYTLQLFALSGAESVDRLLGTYPALDLKVHLAREQRSPFRILYGSFATPDDARRAFTRLPPALADDAGRPVVKSIAELQDRSALR